MEYVTGHNPCPRCRKNGNDKAGNNLMFYGPGRGGHCFSCGFTILSDDERERRGLTDDYEFDEGEVMSKDVLTKSELEKIKGYTGLKGQNGRGITDETYKHYGVRFRYDEETGEVTEQYYPYFSTEGILTGFKVRKLPKEFYMVGKVGLEQELFGQFRWRNSSGKYVLITAGEIDCMSAYQMLEDYRKIRNSDFESIPVVSSGVGESGSWKQIQKFYEWLKGFEKIVVCYDNDEAGKKAVEKLADVLPKGKMFVMKLALKDANEYLKQGREKQFINLFYAADAYSPAGVVGSGELPNRMREEIACDKIEFPPFMRKVNEMTGGGLSLGRICNIGAASGIGKTVYIDTIIYHLIFNSPYRVGVVSMELNAAQYGISMLSRHIGRKISNIANKDERIAFMESEYVLQKERELFYREDGTHRWHLVDDRDGSLEELKAVVEQLIIACDCKLIVLDPLQDILDGLDNEQQALFMKWLKGMVKSHSCSFLLINHVRKSGSGEKQNSQGAMISEESFAGSSTIFKSAALNILLVRNKMAEDEIERNTTYAYLSKNRDNGITGPCGEYYYDNDTHQLWDKEEWLATQPAPDY